MQTIPNAASMGAPGIAQQYGMWQNPGVNPGLAKVHGGNLTEKPQLLNPNGVNPGITNLEWEGMEDFEDAEHPA